MFTFEQFRAGALSSRIANSSLWSMLLVKILYLQENMAIFSSRKLGPWLKISLGNDFMIYVVTILANSGPSSIKIFTTMIFARKYDKIYVQFKLL